MHVYLYAERDGLHSSQRVPVERVKAVVSHDRRLQYVTAPAVQHEESLIHLHGLICREMITLLNNRTHTAEEKRTGLRAVALFSPAVWKLRATS